MDLASLLGSPDGKCDLLLLNTASPSENSSSVSNLPAEGTQHSYSTRRAASLATFSGKKGHRSNSPISITPAALLKGLHDPARSYEDLLSDSPSSGVTSQIAPVINETPRIQGTHRGTNRQTPWSLLMHRQLAQALGTNSSDGRTILPTSLFAYSPGSPLSSGHNDGSSISLRGSGCMLISAIVRPLTMSEQEKKTQEVLLLAPDGRTLLLVRPDIFQGAKAEHVAAAAATYGQATWAQRFKFHLCVKASEREMLSHADGMQPVASVNDSDSNDNTAINADDNNGIRGNSRPATHSLASSLSQAVLGGQSSVCFMYGAAGSGRSTLLLGPAARNKDSLPTIAHTVESEAISGIAPLAFSQVIDAVLSHADTAADTVITINCINICGDHFTDLLATPADTVGGSAHDAPSETDTEFVRPLRPNSSDKPALLRLREHPVDGPYVAGARQLAVTSVNDALTALRIAQQRHAQMARRTSSTTSATTALSELAGHFVATLELRPKLANIPSESEGATFATIKTASTKDNDLLRAIRLHMVLLAPMPQETMNTNTVGAAAVAANQSIRRSLHTLGQIFSALGRLDTNSSTDITGSATANKHALPYRDSSLTMLLKDALAGQGLVLVTAALSPSDIHYDDSLATAKLVSQWAPPDLQTAHAVSVLPPAAAAHPLTPGKGLHVRPHVSSAVGSDWELNQCAATPGGKPISFQAAIEKLHEGLGARTGTTAARTLLQAAISDPQQKAGRGGNAANPHIKASQHTPPPHAHINALAQTLINTSSPGTHIALGDLGNADSLRDKNRALEAALVEMQLELDCARTDRDSLRADLNIARAGLLQASSSPGGTASTATAASPRDKPSAALQLRKGGLQKKDVEQLAATSSAQLEAAQRELRALRSILLNKEDALEKLTETLRSEQEDRMAMERTAESTVRDCLQRFGEMQARIEELEQAESRAVGQANDASAAVRALREAVTGHEQSSLLVSNGLEQELTAERERNAAISAELRIMQQEMQELKALQTRHKGEVDTLQAALEAAKEIHEVELQRERQQSEKMLLERQLAHNVLEAKLQETVALADRARADVIALQSQHSALLHSNALQQGSVHSLLVSGGSSLQHKTEDTRQLMETVASLRASLASLPQTKVALADERALRKDDNEKAQALLRRQMNALQEMSAKAEYWEALANKQRQYVQKMEVAYGEVSQTQQQTTVALHDAQEQTRRWQRKAEEASCAVDTGSAAALEESKRRLLLAEATLETQRMEAEAAQAAMQQEYATLWIAVQDLNKLDAKKDTTIQTLVQEQQYAKKKMQQILSAYTLLQRELTAIDDELLAAAQAEGLGDVAERIFHLRERAIGQTAPLTPADAASLIKSVPLSTSAAELVSMRKGQFPSTISAGSAGSSRTSGQQHAYRSRVSNSVTSDASPLTIYSATKDQQAELQEQELCRTLDDINALLERSPSRTRSRSRSHSPPPHASVPRP